MMITEYFKEDTQGSLQFITTCVLFQFTWSKLQNSTGETERDKCVDDT